MIIYNLDYKRKQLIKDRLFYFYFILCKLKDDGESLLRYEDLYKAAIGGDWETAERIFESDPEAKRAIISTRQETALHVATSMGRTQFVEKLVKLLSPKRPGNERL